MNKIGGKIILWGLILAMLGFTTVRTIHFLQATFPPDQAYVAYLGLAAFDIGVLGWFYYASQSAEGVAQRTIAYGMIFVCAAGVIVTTVADMLLGSSENGLTKLPPYMATVALWAVMIVIVLNFLAGILVHLADPRHQRHMAQEGARDKIHAATMVHINQKADQIAPLIAQRVADHWGDQIVQEMIGMIPGQTKGAPAMPAAAPAPSLPTGKIVDAKPVQPVIENTPKMVPASVKQIDSVPREEPSSAFMNNFFGYGHPSIMTPTNWKDLKDMLGEAKFHEVVSQVYATGQPRTPQDDEEPESVDTEELDNSPESDPRVITVRQLPPLKTAPTMTDDVKAVFSGFMGALRPNQASQQSQDQE